VYSLSTKQTGNISAKLVIFNIPPITAWVAVMYFMAKSRLHIVINYLRLPEPHQSMLYLSPYHQPVPNSANFCKNVETHGNGQMTRLVSKFCIPLKSVDPNHYC